MRVLNISAGSNCFGISSINSQGGDGYQYFMNHDLALASIARIVEFCFGRDNLIVNDPFYESPDFGIEFVNTIKNFNTEIMDDPNYAALLNVFGSKLFTQNVHHFLCWCLTRKNHSSEPYTC